MYLYVNVPLIETWATIDFSLNEIYKRHPNAVWKCDIILDRVDDDVTGDTWYKVGPNFKRVLGGFGVDCRSSVRFFRQTNPQLKHKETV